MRQAQITSWLDKYGQKQSVLSSTLTHTLILVNKFFEPKKCFHLHSNMVEVDSQFDRSVFYIETNQTLSLFW